ETAVFRELGFGRVLGDDERLRRDQRAAAECGEGPRAVVGGVRRIEEHELEPPALGGESRELSDDIAAGDVRARSEVERPDVLGERVQGPPVALDERDGRGPARERLEPDPARPREEIEQPRVRQPRPERVQQRGPYLIRGRPGRRPLRRHEPPPLVRSRNHPHESTITRVPTRSRQREHELAITRMVTRSSQHRVSWKAPHELAITHGRSKSDATRRRTQHCSRRADRHASAEYGWRSCGLPWSVTGRVAAGAASPRPAEWDPLAPLAARSAANRASG